MTDLLDQGNAEILNYKELLVGEGKKFRDEEALAKGKYESDLYVKILETRLDEKDEYVRELRDANTKTANLQELIDQLDARQKSSESTDAKEVKPYDPNEMKKQISSTIQEIEREKQEEANYSRIRNKLVERYGDNYQSTLQKQLGELGLDSKTVTELARKHPTVLEKTLGLDQEVKRESFQAPPTSSQRNDNFAPRNQKRTWSYYQEMKKTNPKLYFDPQIAVQMVKDAHELGDTFNDGDFKKFG